MNQHALTCLLEAMQSLEQARSILRREVGPPPPFTRQQALADAKAKADQYNGAGRAAIDSLIADWEEVNGVSREEQQRRRAEAVRARLDTCPEPSHPTLS